MNDREAIEREFARLGPGVESAPVDNSDAPEELVVWPLPYDPNDRRTFIGGSDSARIMGLGPPAWGSAVDLYFAKIDGEQVADPARAKLYRRGKRLEPYGVQILQEDFDVEIVGRNIRYQDATVPYFSGEIDFEWRDESGAIQNGEIKSVNFFAADKWGEEGTGDIPIEYACQAWWNLGIAPGRRERCMVGALFGADNMVRYWIERDDEILEAMRAKAVEFWQSFVVPRIPPPPRTLEDIGRLWPQQTAKAIEATPDVAAAWTTLQLFRNRARQFEEAKDAAEFLLGEHMKDAGRLTFQGRDLCTYNKQSRTTIDADALQREAPELYAKLARTTTFRQFRAAQQRKG